MRGHIRKEGMGGFLHPPGHPENSLSVSGPGFSMSLSSAVSSEWLDEGTKQRARAALDSWERRDLDDPYVQDWIRQCLGYFRNCYVAEGSDTAEVWNTAQYEVIPDIDPREASDRQAGVRHVRRYYPEYEPNESDFEEAYWGAPKLFGKEEHAKRQEEFSQRSGISSRMQVTEFEPKSETGPSRLAVTTETAGIFALFSLCGGVRHGFPNSTGTEPHYRFEVAVYSEERGERVNFRWYGGTYDYRKGRQRMTRLDMVRAFQSFIEDGLYGDQSFADFCGDLGYDRSDVKAGRIYQGCKQALRKAQRIGISDAAGLVQELEGFADFVLRYAVDSGEEEVV